MILKTVAGAALGAVIALSLAAPSAHAAMPAPAPQATENLVVPVWGGCGPYGHRGPWGGCRSGGQWGGRPYYRPYYRPFYGPRPYYYGPRRYW